jgi:phosphonate transport system substrate-binding protein
MKKIVVMAIFLCICIGLLAGCGGGEKKKSAENSDVKELKIAFSPYQDAETIKTAVGPLRSMLQAKLKEKGFPVGTLTISVGTSYSAVGEALSSGSADVGFLSGATYVLFDKETDVLLTALRQGISKDTADLKVWNNNEPEKFTDNLVQHYRSVLVTGPSFKGKALLEKVKGGRKPSWEELDALTWTVMSPASASGYQYPSLYLKKEYGKTLADLSHVVQAESYTTSMARLASGQADIAVAFSHIRIRNEKNWQTKLGGTDTIWKQTGIIGVTDKIYNDTVCVSKTSKVMQNQKFRKALGESLIEIGKTKEGIEALRILGHKGYDWADAKNYDDERRVQRELKGK